MRSAGTTRIGPNTAPKVEAKRIVLIADARVFTSARSVAAYRESKFAA